MIEPVKQRTERECGPACLAMICQDIGIPVSQEDISVLLRTGPRGVSAHRIIETAARLGLHARGIALSAEHMQHVFLPCIAHWCNTHFVVVERVDRHGVTMIDPGVGRLTISSRRFAQLFSGTAIEFEQTGP